MVMIDSRQMAALDADAQRRFVARVIEHVADSCPSAAGLDADTLRRCVEAGIARARGHGLSWQSAIATFVGLMFEIAPDFDRDADVVLAGEFADPNLGFRTFVDRAAESVWEAAFRDDKTLAWRRLLDGAA